jgi:hypothetical protein
MFLEETPRGRSHNKEYKPKQKGHHTFKIGTWTVRTLNQGGKLKNLKEMLKNAVSVLSVSEVRWERVK